MRKIYNSPEVEIEKYTTANVITTSNEGGGGYIPGEDIEF